MKIDPTKEELHKLYVLENKNDQQISELFNIGKFRVWQLRKMYGIKGISPQHRKYFLNPQNPINDRQRQIIMGSLLGDCCLKNSGKTAHLSISHSIKQKEYIDWLYSELKSICPSTVTYCKNKNKNGKEYITYYFSSESRIDLNEIRNKIYIPKKTVTEWWVDQITPLGISVWFMDDGCFSMVNPSRFEFSFATNSFSEKENYILSEMFFNKFGIKSEVRPITKKLGVQYNLFISDVSFDKFREIVSPHIIDCMKYKIDIESKKYEMLKNMSCSINKDTIIRLYNDEKMTYSQIANIYNVNEGVIKSYMFIYGVRARNNTEAQLGGKNQRAVRGSGGEFKKIETTEEQNKLAKEISDKIRKGGFPYIKIKDASQCIGTIEKLCNKREFKTEYQKVNDYSNIGFDICLSFCPQIFSMSAKDTLSPVEVFSDDEMLLDCAKRAVLFPGKDVNTAIRRELKNHKRNRCVSLFSPMWAKTIINRVFSGRVGLSMLDPSCGFCGRLLGSYGSGIVSYYCGIDPIKENIESNTNVAKLIDRHAFLKKFEFKSDFICDTAEAALPLLNKKFDIIFTSPPYFDKEKYSKDISQCYNKFNGYSDWKENWLKNILQLSYSKLNSSGAMIVFASNYDKYFVGNDCRDIMSSLSNQLPECISFKLPFFGIYGNRSPKYDTAWIIRT